MSPSSSPSTIPASTARRSPSSPTAIARATCARSRSETPPIPPRRPTMRQSPPRRTTWTPRRASQPRSSKPSSGPLGAVTTARRVRTAPCGGERPRGSSSRTRSRIERPPNWRTSAGTRSAKRVRRTGPVTVAVRGAERPSSGLSTLRSKASRRALPHHQPTRASATAHAGTRARLEATAAVAPITIAAMTTAGAPATFAKASPTQKETTSSVGQARAITARPGRGAARSVPVRSPGSRRGPRPSRSRHAEPGSRRSSEQ